ncbi:hypothetical protein [Microbispora bryophytorum]|uniref:DUF1963 domain-containing protein n=1 Tax=Microbispora bryophytorum TaxID=1460882 RepID=A0A8H9LBL9_9ACTN|nr:hypothetical protein [Microbispora bryophytorum]MBD3137667.1 hypothetical protein [Microbispora bryophytorum]TQS05951.1 hypothetical protein FLX07_16435 [Microbispora bryophytorum]GGO20286.1 hypothetical protein GCM10011574_46610 [Microbispora bryophytorum]
MARTTPPHPVDIAAVFPEIAPLARTATRLHPRPGTPGLYDSSIGGPLLWPFDEPWPTCGDSHEDAGGYFTRLDTERRRRRILSAAWGRTRKGERLAITPEEQAELDGLDEDYADPDTPATMLGVAQLFMRDVPGLAGPAGADVLQILWCPRDHEPHYSPSLMLRWRRSSDVTDVLTDQPEPEVMEYDTYLPVPCVLHPEQVVEYPYKAFLPSDLKKRIRLWEEASGHRYFYDLSIADGWKVGGYAAWNLTDPYPMLCDDCGADMDMLVKIDGSEWDGTERWRPLEDAGPENEFHEHPNRWEPTGITIGRGYALWIFTCPVSFDHPHGVSMQ